MTDVQQRAAAKTIIKIGQVVEIKSPPAFGWDHYTSIETIHKVIVPLFLDDLRNELAAIRERDCSG